MLIDLEDGGGIGGGVDYMKNIKDRAKKGERIGRVCEK